jgi:hypothetical protein
VGLDDVGPNEEGPVLQPTVTSPSNATTAVRALRILMRLLYTGGGSLVPGPSLDYTETITPIA